MQRKCAAEDGEDSEFRREEFRQPRNCLLNMAAELLRCCWANFD